MLQVVLPRFICFLLQHFSAQLIESHHNKKCTVHLPSHRAHTLETLCQRARQLPAWTPGITLFNSAALLDLWNVTGPNALYSDSKTSHFRSFWHTQKYIQFYSRFFHNVSLREKYFLDQCASHDLIITLCQLGSLALILGAWFTYHLIYVT